MTSGRWSTKSTAAAVPGASHVIKGGVVCQDAAKVVSSGEYLVMAVADGHGDKKHARSDEGSRIAVNVMTTVLLQALRSLFEGVADPAHALSRSVQEEVGRRVRTRLALEWNRRVKLHDMYLAIADRTAQALPADFNEVDGSWQEVAKLYGTTLIAAGFYRNFGMIFQLGDGGALIVGPDGSSAQAFDAADKTYGAATLSLSGKSWLKDQRMRARFIDMERESVSLVVLCTDGVVDAYDEGGFERDWGSKQLTEIQSKGWTKHLSMVTEYLCKVGTNVGDDSSIALAWWPNAIAESEEPEESEARDGARTSADPQDDTVEVTIVDDPVSDEAVDTDIPTPVSESEEAPEPVEQSDVEEADEDGDSAGAALDEGEHDVPPESEDGEDAQPVVEATQQGADAEKSPPRGRSAPIFPHRTPTQVSKPRSSDGFKPTLGEIPSVPVDDPNEPIPMPAGPEDESIDSDD